MDDGGAEVGLGLNCSHFVKSYFLKIFRPADITDDGGAEVGHKLM